ncbi:hypothetical protein HK101_004030 [Irineochytrium annulatum]|nr:hypothetical protein HK101_004030 [Irineochytrium annulatum]
MTISPNDCIYVGVVGYLKCLRKSDGVELWEHPLTGLGWKPVSIVPDTVNDTLLVASGANLRCISASTGQQVYENRLIGIGIGYAHMAAGRDAATMRRNAATLPPHRPPPSYAGDDGKVAHMVTDPDDMIYVSHNYIVRAIRMCDGVQLWEHKTGLFGGYGTQPHLLIEDGTLYVAGQGRVFALKASKGTLLWQSDIKRRGLSILATMRSGLPSTNLPNNLRSIASSKSTSPSLLDAIFVGASGYCTSLEKSTGSPFLLPRPDANRAGVTRAGDVPLTGRGFNPVVVWPVARLDAAIVSCGINLRRVNMTNGLTEWENCLVGMGMGMPGLLVGAGAPPPSNDAFNAELLPGYEASAPAPALASSSSAGRRLNLDEVVFLAVHGTVKCVRMRDGVEIWTHAMSFGTRIHFPHLFVEDDMVYMAGLGRLLCLDAYTGEQIWLRSGGEVHSGDAFISTMRSGPGETNRSPVYTILQRQTAEDRANRNS